MSNHSVSQAAVAQLVELKAKMREIPGSMPLWSTISPSLVVKTKRLQMSVDTSSWRQSSRGSSTPAHEHNTSTPALQHTHKHTNTHKHKHTHIGHTHWPLSWHGLGTGVKSILVDPQYHRLSAWNRKTGQGLATSEAQSVRWPPVTGGPAVSRGRKSPATVL